MRHIKLFEDYTEEELRDLQDDLHEIGIRTKFTLGEDFGFGGEPPFKTVRFILEGKLILTEEMGKSLIKKGILVEAERAKMYPTLGTFTIKDLFINLNRGFTPFFELEDLKKDPVDKSKGYVLWAEYDWSIHGSIEKRNALYEDFAKKTIDYLEAIRI